MDHNLSLSVDGVPQTVAIADKVVTAGITGIQPWNELLLNTMKSSINSVGDATHFLVGQIPDVLQQLVIWMIIYHSAQALAGVTILGFTLFILFRYSKHTEGKWSLWHNNKGEIELHSMASFTFLSITGFIGVNLINIQWALWLFAPKFALVNYGLQLGKTAIGG